MSVVTHAPSLDDIERLAKAAWDEMPGAFKRLAGDVLFRIEDFADDDVLSEVGLDDPFELTGLYQGIALARASITNPAPAAPMVFLYRRAILEEWIERGDVALAELVRHVLIHEVGHHFGLSDEQIDALLEGEN